MSGSPAAATSVVAQSSAEKMSLISIRDGTNPDGLIPYGVAREKAPGTLRVMVFGDSMVVGRALAQNQIYTALLANWMGTDPIDVIDDAGSFAPLDLVA